MYYLEESSARIELAKNQNKIIKCLFDNISTSGFDIDIDLSDMPSTRLKDFWLYTTGFLGLLNYENDDNILREDDIIKILQGKFSLKPLTDTEVKKMLADIGQKEKRSGYSQSYKLYSIQDGTYTILKNIGYERLKGVCGKLFLETRPIEIFTDNKYFDTDPTRILKLIRNSLAHDVPFINGNMITLRCGEDEIDVSKMWMRGFAETFAMLSRKIDDKRILQELMQQLPLQGNYIDTDADIDKALSVIKNCFDEEIRKNFYRINNFVKVRIKYEPGFFEKSFEEKVRELAAIVSNNPNIITSSVETISPAIVYNLQQLVAKELVKRGEDAYLTEEDIKMDYINELIAEKDRLDKKVELFQQRNPVLKNQMQRKQNYALVSELERLMRKLQDHLNYIETARKLECSNMDISINDNLDVLPVEVAANLVYLLAFNNLVTSGFYEDTLANTDFSNLTDYQKGFFNKFDMSKLQISFGPKKAGKLSANDKAFLLSCMRNSLCHGLVNYKYLPVKQGETPTYEDVYLTFNTDAGTTISGKLIDFYNFFGSDGFLNERKPKIITNERFLDELKEEKVNSENAGNNAEESAKPKQPNDDE